MKNKNDAAAEFHRMRIREAAEILFSEKGFEKTTINDISKLSEYSRRTIYAYYESKEDILNHIVESGLLILKSDIETALAQSDDFFIRYKKICTAMKNYTSNFPHSSKSVNESNAENLTPDRLNRVTKNIILLGTEINELLAQFIDDGKKCGAVRKDIKTLPTVYILWSSISALLELVKSKSVFLTKSLGMTKDEFSKYGFEQILSSLLIKGTSKN